MPYSREYYLRNRATRNERAKKWNREHAARVKEIKARWAKKNAQHRREYQQQYYRANKARINARRRGLQGGGLMREHYPGNTVSVERFCKRHRRRTQHRVDAHVVTRVCLECQAEDEAARKLRAEQPPKSVQEELFA